MVIRYRVDFVGKARAGTGQSRGNALCAALFADAFLWICALGYAVQYAEQCLRDVLG